MTPVKILPLLALLIVSPAVESARSEDDQGPAAVRQVAYFSVVTSVQVVTATFVITTKSICASLVNVTGACQRRRRGVVDRPVILSFDDDDDQLDILRPSSPVQRYATDCHQQHRVA